MQNFKMKKKVYTNIKWTYNKNKIYKLEIACYRDSGRNNFIILWKIVRIKGYRWNLSYYLMCGWTVDRSKLRKNILSKSKCNGVSVCFLCVRNGMWLFFKWSSGETWELLADSFLTESALDVYVSVEERKHKGWCNAKIIRRKWLLFSPSSMN